MKKLLAAMIALAIGVLGAAEVVFHAEDIQTPGDWNTAKYANCTVLKCGKIGGVAEGTFNVPEAGKYNMYVRTSNHGGGFRCVTVSINGMKYGKFGDEKDKPNGFGWGKCAIPVPLKAGENRIKLVGNSDYTRLDCIVFTTEDAEPKVPAQSTKERTLSGEELEGIFGRPKSTGNGPEVLALVGGRPWVGNGLGKSFINAGFRVELLNGVYLDGKSGASIKQTPTDPVEPKALDGITPNFAKLDKFAAVVVAGIPEKFQKEIFTPARVEQLKKYVADGGKLMLTINAPAELADLLPVELEQSYEDESFVVRRPENNPWFAALPETWTVLRDFRIAKPKAGAKIVCGIYNDNDFATAYAVKWPYGKGEVLFVNADHERRQNATQLMTWAYQGVLWSALLADLTNPDTAKVDPAKVLPAPLKRIPSQVLESAKVELRDPVLALADADKVAIDGETIVFGNGVKVVVKDRSAIDVYRPGAAKPYLVNLALPQINYPAKADKVDSRETAEAVNVKTSVNKSKAKWSIDAIRAEGNTAVLTVKSDEGGVFEWTIKGADLDLDGRKFTGIAHRVELAELPGHLLAQIALDYQVKLGNKRIRRFACYNPPRGYAEFDVSGKSKVDIAAWGFFATGQPFGWIEGSDGVSFSFISGLTPTGERYGVAQGQDAVNVHTTFNFGRVKAPQSTAFYYQLVGAPEYNTSNDWLAAYQFVRKYLRKVADFPEIPAYPISGNYNTCSGEQAAKVRKLAKEYDFRIHKIDRCPSPMESYETEDSDRGFDAVSGDGFMAYPWFPCAHSPDKTRTVQEHPEWYFKDENGKLVQYFGHFYVANLDNPEFRKWHYGLVDRMFAHGVRTVWYDMGGAYTGMTDFALPESRCGFYPQVDLYRYFYQKGGWVVTEGQNPLTLDGYLYRPNVYPYAFGNEFAFVGACPTAHDALAAVFLDNFRVAMYGAFINLNLDPVAFNFDTIPNEQKELKRVLNYVPTWNLALDSTGMPFVRETPFGTSWIGEKGGALFFFHGVKNLSVDLPEGMKAYSLTNEGSREIKMLDGKLPTEVAPGSIIVLKK